MTHDEIKALLFELIGEIAPEADFSSLSDDEDMRSALDLELDGLQQSDHRDS